jgi:4'-phosphopantetheinyl transferase
VTLREAAADVSARRALVLLCRLPADDAEGHARRGLALLPPALHAEIVRYRRAEDRLARVAARLLLRHGLRMLGLREHSGLEGWRRTPSGRPYLEDCPADFSLSHSGDRVAAALGRGCRLGIDVEFHRPLDPQVFAFLLTPEEQARIAAAAAAAAGEDDGTAAFLRFWALREAVLKADGSGFLVPDETIRAIGRGHYPGGRRWHIDQRDLDGGCLALAVDRAAALPATLAWQPFERLT